MDTVVPLFAPECRCDRDSGRYWLHGEWHCKATRRGARGYPTIGWKHYPGHRTNWQNPSTPTATELEQAS